MTKAPILLGGLVAALTLLAEGHPWWGLIAFCVSIYLTNLVQPFRDPVRLFSDEMRRVIWRRAGGVCEWPGCGAVLHYEGDCPVVTYDKDGVEIDRGCQDCYQADHVFPWSKGGRTSLDNGQALCRKHNLLKSDR